MRYGSQVTVTNGSLAGKTFYMASPDINVANGALESALVTQGSTTVSVLSTAGLVAGQAISGPGIAEGTIITQHHERHLLHDFAAGGGQRLGHDAHAFRNRSGRVGARTP